MRRGGARHGRAGLRAVGSERIEPTSVKTTRIALLERTTRLERTMPTPCLSAPRYATNCAVHRFKEAGGCEAEMMFVRPLGDFNQEIVRSFCTAARPHSCGPGALSLQP